MKIEDFGYNLVIMMKRSIHPTPIKLPEGFKLEEIINPKTEGFGFIPGQAAAVRFFDPDSRDDFDAMLDIVKAKESRKWMDDTRLSRADYREWAGDYSDTSYLFAVHDARMDSREDLEKIRGFVYIYNERAEKFRVKRMEQLGFLSKSDEKRLALEVSFALRPMPSGQQSGSGLMSSALRQSCMQIRAILNYPKQANLVLFAFIDPENIPSRRTVEAAGFQKVGEMTYDSTTREQKELFILNWTVLHNKLTGKLLELYESRPESTLPHE